MFWSFLILAIIVVSVCAIKWFLDEMRDNLG